MQYKIFKLLVIKHLAFPIKGRQKYQRWTKKYQKAGYFSQKQRMATIFLPLTESSEKV